MAAGTIPVGDRAEMRASFSRWGGRDRAHLRTWYQRPDGTWRPTTRRVTVLPEQFEDL